jgi:alcohol dehydrogenase (cytochrome c)
MKRFGTLCVLSAVILAAAPARSDDAADMAQLGSDWPTYHGDYTGQRHSPLKQIDARNVSALALSWVFHADVPAMPGIPIKPVNGSTPVEKDGVLYFSMPNHVWAVDARTGRQVWHYVTKSGATIGNRGVAVVGKSVYFETPDNHLVAIDANTGQERWRVEIADSKLGYFSSAAPVLAHGHMIVAAGGDSLDLPGYLQARDPDTGALQWQWRATPEPGQPGSETWPSKDAMDHGGGMPWLPGTYDPKLNLVYWGTGNPNPVHAGQSRKGDNLWTCSIVALNADTGKLVWYYQVSPHDTHDWDAVQTPVLFDGEFGGKQRHLLMQASRNGYFFLLDRATGEHLLTAAYTDVNWAKGLDKLGRPIPDPDKEPKPDGTLVTPASGGATNWPAPSFDPETGLLFVKTTKTYSLYYLTDTSDKPAGFGGKDDSLESRQAVTALDYRTGKARWVHDLVLGTERSGILSTDGKLLFTGNTEEDVVALETGSGKSLWHSHLGATIGGAPITYQLDGRQYLVVSAGTDLYGFALPASASGEPRIN